MVTSPNEWKKSREGWKQHTNKRTSMTRNRLYSVVVIASLLSLYWSYCTFHHRWEWSCILDISYWQTVRPEAYWAHHITKPSNHRTTLLSPQTIVNFTPCWTPVLELRDRIWRVFPSGDAKKTKGHEFEYCCGFCFQKRRAKWRLHLAGKKTKSLENLKHHYIFFYLISFFSLSGKRVV